MKPAHEASRCRQRIAGGLARLAHLAEVAQSRGSMIPDLLTRDGSPMRHPRVLENGKRDKPHRNGQTEKAVSEMSHN